MVAILLATYNGAKYLRQQIESLLSQTYTDWRLFIRDDHSSDDTPEILAEYVRKYPDKFFLLKDELGNLGSSQNFNALLQVVKEEEYIMFCDQDDFWLPDKIDFTLNQMLELESVHGKECPLLMHTSFRYVDSNLKDIDSKKDFHATKISELSLRHLIAQNPIYGCTVMINNSLTKLVGVIPAIAENHDYWIAMVASALGKINYSTTRTLLYRQHGNNVSGNYNDNSLVQRFKRIIIQKKNLKDAKSKIDMAKELKIKYYNQLNSSQLNLIDNFIEFSETKSIQLLLKNLNNGVRRQTISQTFLFYSSVFFLK